MYSNSALSIYLDAMAGSIAASSLAAAQEAADAAESLAQAAAQAVTELAVAATVAKLISQPDHLLSAGELQQVQNHLRWKAAKLRADSTLADDSLATTAERLALAGESQLMALKRCL
jgi:hypothetical protein